MGDPALISELTRSWDLDDLARTHWQPWESWPPRDRDLPDEWDVRRDLDLPDGWSSLDEQPRTMRQNRPSWFYFWGGPTQYRSDIQERSWKHNRSTQYKVIDMTKHVYKIRRRSDGHFSGGGHRPTFSRIGKVWSGPGPLKSHLTLIAGNHSREGMDRLREVYAGCEVVTYSVVSPEVDSRSIEDFLDSV